MYRIKALNKISPAGLSVLDQSRFAVSTDVENEDGILVRSADMHEYVFPENLRAIARAGAGTNNIPIDRCSEAGIAVFNTPGANANAVKELVICAMLLSSRNVVGGAAWVREQAAAGADVEKVVEKGKSQFVGPEIQGKTLGVVGLGAIGVQVANIATKLGMTVWGYDPFLSVDAALSLSRMVQRANDLETIYKNCDYITLHLPLNGDTKGMIDASAIQMMKSGVRVINLARGGLVSDDDMLQALESGKVACYVTDFPNSRILTALEQPWSGIARLCIIHRNIPGAIANITKVLSDDNVNVENMTNKSKKDYAYTVVDINTKIRDDVVDEIRALEGVLRVRLLSH